MKNLLPLVVVCLASSACGLTMGSQLRGATFSEHDYPSGTTGHFSEGTCRVVDPSIAAKNAAAAEHNAQAARQPVAASQTYTVYEKFYAASGCGIANYCTFETTKTVTTKPTPIPLEQIITDNTFQHGYTYDVIADGAGPKLFERYLSTSVGMKGQLVENHWVEGDYDIYFMSIRSNDRGWLYMIPLAPGKKGARVEYLDARVESGKPTGTKTAICELLPPTP